ncbi:hypothetical protein PV797_04245 [Clostridiaceae bacterium M8S5]|nr:hypothetical protein PV797_04245 [Clostridiaceae bacterium M8S5]
MKPVIWYLLVIADIVTLIFSVMTKNIFMASMALILSLYLKRYIKQIPLPKYFNSMKVVRFKDSTRKID